MTTSTKRHRILLLAEYSTPGEQELLLDAVATAVHNARAGDAERMTGTLVHAGGRGPWIRFRGATTGSIAADVDASALVLECLDRPMGDEATRDTIRAALRAIVSATGMTQDTTTMEAPTPWHPTDMFVPEQVSGGGMWFDMRRRQATPDPALTDLLPDVVVVGGSRDELSLSPLAWTGMRAQLLVAMESLRALSELRALNATMDAAARHHPERTGDR